MGDPNVRKNNCHMAGAKSPAMGGSTLNVEGGQGSLTTVVKDGE